jgi:ribosomal-protein-alanine N-acetyltransferase
VDAKAAAAMRRKVPADAEGIVAVARALPEWFNAEGQASIAREAREQAGWVAVEAGRVAAFALWVRRGAKGAELTWMGVTPARRRSGIGARLLDAVCADAADNGAAYLDVSTVADSVAYAPYAETRAFYRACGFEDLRVDRGYFKDPKGNYDRLVLRREI